VPYKGIAISRIASVGFLKMIFFVFILNAVMRAFYYLSNCSTCKKILQNLSLPQTIQRVDIKKNPLNEATLKMLYNLSGSYESLFSKRAQLYKARNLKEKNLTEEDYKNLLLEHYSFLKRPVLCFDNNIFIGNSPKVVATAQAFLNEQ